MPQSRLLYPDVLRVFAIIGVVLIHVTAPTIGILHQLEHVEYWWTSNLINGAFRWSVPMFIMISGMLLLGSDKTDNAKHFYKNRLSRLLPPFVIWSLIYYIWGIRHEPSSFHLGILLKQFVASNVHYHLWFVYMLLTLYIIAPLLRLIVKHATAKLIVYVCAICFIAHNITAVASLKGWALGIQVPFLTGYIGYFLLGYYLSVVEVQPRLRRILYLGGIASYLIVIFGNYGLMSAMPNSNNNLFFYDYRSIPVLIMASALFVWGKQLRFDTVSSSLKRTIHFVSLSTFSIYLSHLLVFEFLYEKKPWDILNGNPLVYVPLVTAIVLFVSFMFHLMWQGLIRLTELRVKSSAFALLTGTLIQQSKQIYDYREMLWNLVIKELRSRYKGSVLGFLWTFVNPMLMLGIYSFVFSFIMKTDIPNFPMFIVVALLPWNFFSESILQGARCYIQHSDLLKKIYFPREVLPLAAILSSLINYMFTLAVLIPALWLFGIPMTLALSAFPIVLMVQILLILPIVMIVSIGTVYFRDLEHILNVIMIICFYLTPVLFPIQFIPEAFRWVFTYNPMTPLIHAYRDLFLYGLWPDMGQLMQMVLVLIVVNIGVLALFTIVQRHVVEEI